MSIIFDALKKAQIKLTSRHSKSESSKATPSAEKDKPRTFDQTVNKATGFAFGEDLTQPLKPIEGTMPQEKPKEVSEVQKSKVPESKRHAWTIYDVRKMNPLTFFLFVIFGLLGCALVFYIFNFKLKDKFLIQAQVTEQRPSSGSRSATSTPGKKTATAVDKKTLFYLSPEVSLSLDGIVSSGGKNIALIDDQIVEVGDTVKGATVLSIGSKEVAISFQGKEIILILK